MGWSRIVNQQVILLLGMIVPVPISSSGRIYQKNLQVEHKTKAAEASAWHGPRETSWKAPSRAIVLRNRFQ